MIDRHLPPLRRARIMAALLLSCMAPWPMHAEGERNVLDLAAELGALVEWDAISRSVVLLRGPDRVSLVEGSPWLVLNQRMRYPAEPPFARNGAVYLTGAASAQIHEVLDGRAARRWRVGVVMIDPGHGGYDPGTLSRLRKDASQIQEKDVVLATSQMLAALLRAELPDRRILMTRTDDTFVGLETRAEMANAVQLGRNEAMIYVSVHANGGFNTRTNGFEVWVFPSQERRTVLDRSTVDPDMMDIYPILNGMREDEFNAQSSGLAQAILAGLGLEVGDVSTNRGQKTESWAVVREALMPAVLVELGFLSNEDEAAHLSDPEYQRRLAVGICRGVMDFVARFEEATSFLD